MKKVLYTKYNPYRKPEYQLSTAVVAENDKRYVVKKPLSKLAISHIEKIKNNYNSIKKAYSNIIPIDYTEKGNSLFFPFLYGHSLLEAVEKDNIDMECLISQIKEIIANILDVNDEYKVVFERTEAFRKVFNDIYPKEGIPAFSFCNVDSIISNFIKCDDTIYCIDYEWCFDFPIPVDYLKYRILLYLYYEKKCIFQDKLSLDELLRMFNIDDNSKTVFESMEACFQKYVHGNCLDNVYTSRYQKKVLRLEDIIAESQRQKQQIQEQYQHILKLDQHILDLGQNISDLKSQVSEKNDQIVQKDGLINEKNEQIQKQKELIENLQLETARYRKAFRNPFYNLYLKSVMVGISAKKILKKNDED